MLPSSRPEARQLLQLPPLPWLPLQLLLPLSQPPLPPPRRWAWQALPPALGWPTAGSHARALGSERPQLRRAGAVVLTLVKVWGRGAGNGWKEVKSQRTSPRAAGVNLPALESGLCFDRTLRSMPIDEIGDDTRSCFVHRDRLRGERR